MKGLETGKKEIKASLHGDDINLYKKEPKDARKLQKLIIYIGNLAPCKINTKH